MCFGMVIVMVFYNLAINGLIGVMSFHDILIQITIGFIVFILLDIFIVGPVAKKITFSLPFDKSKKAYVIISISFFMVVGMVLLMSLYALGVSYVMNSLSTESFMLSYLFTVIKNFVFAFPVQLIIIGPLVRYLFMKFVKKSKVLKAV